jgi:hypothetical protein
VSPSRSSPAAVIASASGIRSGRSPLSIASTALPTNHGIATVIPIANQAKTSEPITARRYGRR